MSMSDITEVSTETTNSEKHLSNMLRQAESELEAALKRIAYLETGIEMIGNDLDQSTDAACRIDALLAKVSP